MLTPGAEIESMSVTAAAPPVKKPKKPAGPGLLDDRRFWLTVGFGLVLLAFLLLVALISHMFTGRADQSIAESFWPGAMRESGREAENWAGLFGALASHLFMFRMFGLGAFVLPVLLFAFGCRILFRRHILRTRPLYSWSFFAITWLPTFLGYMVYVSETEDLLSFLCGGIGYELALVLTELVGFFTLPVVLLGGGVFLFSQLEPQRVEAMTRHWFARKEGGTPAKPEPKKKAAPAPALNDDEELEVVSEDDMESELDGLLQHAGAHPDPFGPHPVANGAVNGAAVAPANANGLDFEVAMPAAEEPVLEDLSPVFAELEIAEIPEEEIATEVLNMEPYDPTLELGRYQYPSVELLNNYAQSHASVTTEELQFNKDKIVATLSHYGIGIASIKATVGPTVTLYEIVPDAGIRIAKIKNLEDDIALSLAALGIRIIAPIPGKGTVGIEVPNKNREMVALRSVMSTEKFMKSDKELPVVLGKTISNEVFVIDLAKMPHLLMAGATGQGKSVCLNVLLNSLIFRKHPSQLKLVLVDPKKVELSIYAKLERHFLAKLPSEEEAIITDTTKVVHTLNSLCIEMDLRYDLLKEANCRNLKEYNAKFIARRLNPERGHRYLPYIVLVIDELADLMMTAGKQVETPIARLAQLARAVGIHLVVATQRPSVNVITGIIKANFPARLSFKVTSKVDSRTILDAGGADQLIGMGDMLLSTGNEMTRLQCAFIDTPEVETVVDNIYNQRGYSSAYLLPEYDDDNEGGSGKAGVDLEELDPLFDEAARLIVKSQLGSTSLIQRKMKLGYNRAGRLMDQLEASGIVGPTVGSKPRDVLISDDYALEQLLNGLRK